MAGVWFGLVLVPAHRVGVNIVCTSRRLPELEPHGPLNGFHIFSLQQGAVGNHASIHTIAAC